MSMFWIIYIVGCAIVILGGVINDKMNDDLTVGGLLCILIISIFSWMVVLVSIWILIECLYEESYTVKSFLNKKL